MDQRNRRNDNDRRNEKYGSGYIRDDRDNVDNSYGRNIGRYNERSNQEYFRDYHHGQGTVSHKVNERYENYDSRKSEHIEHDSRRRERYDYSQSQNYPHNEQNFDRRHNAPPPSRNYGERDNRHFQREGYINREGGNDRRKSMNEFRDRDDRMGRDMNAPYDDRRIDNRKQISRGGGGDDRNKDHKPRRDELIEDSIYVLNLPLDTTVDELAQLFGSIGQIKIDKRNGSLRIKIYTHPNGKSKGEASISFNDSQAALAAIEWFNQTSIRGNTIKVQMAERTYSVNYINRLQSGNRNQPPRGRGGGEMKRGDGNRGPNRGPPGQAGDWVCSDCKNSNFSWRTTCNRCNANKPQGNNDQRYGSASTGHNYSMNDEY